MARRKSFFRTFLMLGLFALAFYGGWVLYNKYESNIDWTTEKVGKTIKATKKVWEK